MFGQIGYHTRFFEGHSKSSLNLPRSLQTGDKDVIKTSLQKVSDLLLGLSPAIYNDTLKTLKAAEEGLDVIAKSSGSGGGDCGIALSFNQTDTKTLIKRWEDAGIVLLDLEELA